MWNIKPSAAILSVCNSMFHSRNHHPWLQDYKTTSQFKSNQIKSKEELWYNCRVCFPVFKPLFSTLPCHELQRVHYRLRSSRLYLRALGHLRAAGHLHEDSAAKSRFQLNSNVWIAIPKPIIVQWPMHPHHHSSVQHLWLTCLSCGRPWAQTCRLGFRPEFHPIYHKCGCSVHLWESTSNSSHSIDHGSECLQRIWVSLHHHTVTIQMQCKTH